MDINTWLKAEEGRAAELAAHFGLTPSAVSQWRKNGVPLGRMKDVRDFTQGAVSLDEMVPSSANQAGAPEPTALNETKPERAQAKQSGSDRPSKHREGR